MKRYRRDPEALKKSPYGIRLKRLGTRISVMMLALMNDRHGFREATKKQTSLARKWLAEERALFASIRRLSPRDRGVSMVEENLEQAADYLGEYHPRVGYALGKIKMAVDVTRGILERWQPVGPPTPWGKYGPPKGLRRGRR